VLFYLPAAALLRDAAVDKPLAGRRALVVGDPAFDAATHPALHRLPGAAVEAGAVAGTHRVPALIGPDAAEPAIRRELARCDLVHLPAHGRLDPIAPSNSSIVLAGRDELTVSDLVGLRIDSQLAVLSACDSGRGAASLGGEANATAATRRRGAPSAQGAPELPLDPEFVDDLADADPVDSLSGELARVWAPFVVIGV
jgi:CHAT domain-containing protein